MCGWVCHIVSFIIMAFNGKRGGSGLVTEDQMYVKTTVICSGVHKHCNNRREQDNKLNLSLQAEALCWIQGELNSYFEFDQNYFELFCHNIKSIIIAEIPWNAVMFKQFEKVPLLFQHDKAPQSTN